MRAGTRIRRRAPRDGRGPYRSTACRERTGPSTADIVRVGDECHRADGATRWRSIVLFEKLRTTRVHASDRELTDLAETDQRLVEGRLEEWRRRLIDLSHRNRLIAYRPTKATTLHIAAPSIHELLADPDRTQPWDFYFPPELEDEQGSGGESAADTVDELLIRSRARSRTRQPNEIEVTERSPKRIARILDNLAKRSNAEFQDKALRILYLAAGFLDWHDPQRDKSMTSPLVLVPAELRRESTREPYRLYFVSDEDIVINPSLTEKLRRDAGLLVPGDWAWEAKPIASELDEIRRAVASTGWEVREDAVIGLFSFQKYVMYRDLQDNDQQISAHPIVRSLAMNRLADQVREQDPDVPGPDQLDDVQEPELTLSILDADASQRQCVEAAKRGRSFVMQGPPGTGKSQTIANIIAEAIGAGRKVLFVSEKAAALDVVHRRLAAHGLDEYCLMLHGEHAARREVVQALDRSLTSALQPRGGMRGEELARLAQLRTLLNDSVQLLHLPQRALGGRTLREVHEELARWHDAPSVPCAPPPSPLEGQAVLDEANQLGNVFHNVAERWHVSPRDFVWRGYNVTEFTVNDHGRALAALRDLDTAFPALRAVGAKVATAFGLPLPESWVRCRALADLGVHLMNAPDLDGIWLEAPRQALRGAVDEARRAYEHLAASENAYAAEIPARRAADFATGIAERVAASRDAVQQACGWTNAFDSDLQRLERAVRALDDLPSLITTAQRRADDVRTRLGQPEADLDTHQVDRLADLARLAFDCEHRPERAWLVRAGLDRAIRAFDTIRTDLVRYQQLRTELVDAYKPDCFELDAAAIAERFETRYTSVFSRLSGSYRADARALKQVRRDGNLPRDLVADLQRIAEAREIDARIDAAAGTARVALGTYFKGPDTDPQAVAAAIAVARRVLELACPDTDLARLGDAVASGATPDPELAQAADRVQAAYSDLVRRIADLQPFVARPSDLSAETLNTIRATIDQVGGPLRALWDVVADLDRGANRPAASIEDVLRRAAIIAEVHRATSHVAAHREEWRATIGDRFAGADTDWSELEDAATWLSSLERLFVGDDLTPEVRNRLLSPVREWPDVAALRNAAERAADTMDVLTSLFDAERAAQLERTLREDAFDHVADLRAELAESIDHLRDWTEWRRWCADAEASGWGDFVEQLIDAAVPASEVNGAFRRAFWSRRLEAFYAEDPGESEDLRGASFQRWVDEFRELDRRLVRTGADRLIARRERTRKAHVAAPGGEVDLLRREARKKRRHLPVRVLLSRIPTLLSDLKPCLMMSPLTVSHFLAPGHVFDLVIFDEASQVPPQDAVNCIYRGKQLVVAGDSKQLPPTTFFQVAEVDELSPDQEDNSTSEDMESVLDAAEALLPSHALRWHYRSRSESLIAFSNEHMYDGELVTFPSPEYVSARMGVGFVYVSDGVYDRGKTAVNRPEAKVVAQRVAHYLNQTPRRSVGVIAFNTPQAQAIAEELDLLKANHPELEERFRGDRLDAVFVKHLESVQGDERDVIIFSVGYGRDPQGRFLMNFGPLSRDGGQRRLNVAITRAREKVEVVSSVRASDFQLADGASAGARMLRDYIAYAEAGARITRSEADGESVEEVWPSPLEQQVAKEISKLGYVAAPGIGVGGFRLDIGVKSPDSRDRFLLGIECDGDGYARTPTARDRERLRHEVLDSRVGADSPHLVARLGSEPACRDRSTRRGAASRTAANHEGCPRGRGGTSAIDER